MNRERHVARAGIGIGPSLCLAAGLSLGAAMAPSNALAQWQPERPIEFVIQTSPGGGSDIYTRLWLGIIEKYELSPVPLTPVNMPGGAGAVALTYLYGQDGDPHYLTPTLNSIVTTPLQQKLPVMYTSEDLTPVAMMTTDPFLLWVNPEKYKTWEEFHAACKENRLTATGTGARQEDEIQIGLIQEAAGCEPFRYVPQSGGGVVASNVAGGHSDFNVNQPAEALPHFPDKLIPLVVFAKDRHPASPDTPTHWELEIGTENDNEYAKLLDLETGLHQVRGLIGPPNMPEDAKAWYDELFKKVFDSAEWQEFMKTNGMLGTYKGSDGYKEFLVTFEDNHVRMMRDVFGWELRDDLRERTGG
ncbi:Bug family tripartite tricarboxylate transporter substrate binding protein [Allomesorhizobium camelthorni]|uniref:Tripartite tricarboxylate transporter substrate binding protein n=1 Tax=Allomesorhizobium camelthorni TaxID=475069 RepID=A0A6G4WLV5_9HYPH|nr:tripartite tricarboxylate transporter substrate-binding protein [Mesorhizobium camelthorni]NGO55795.1 tripartite tricarboxylate transporter substrate binding protein [Mesorhizobium camelthorni]